MRNKHILFIHIPKTAGTSFRTAAKDYFGEKNTFFDYSPQSPETSDLILKNIYQEKDHFSFYTNRMKHDNSFLSGHFHLSKYAYLYNAIEIVSFVRNPITQVLSHYNHHKNYYGYQKDLESFIHEKRFRNLQSRLLDHMPVALIGFIGLTEEYSTSMKIFNHQYHTNLEYRYINQKSKGSLEKDDIDDRIIEKIINLNSEDMKLYEKFKKIFNIQKGLYEKNLPFTYGMIQNKNKNTISGIAYQRNTDIPIEIDIYNDKNYLDTVSARNLRAGMINKNLPRKGFVGFDYKCKNSKYNGTLYAYVKGTGQEIF